MKFWQVSAGDGSRDYSKLFLQYGVILVGPGSEGDYFQNRETYNNPESLSHRPFIRVLAEDLKQGDVVILRRPSADSWEIIGVGEISSDYQHRDVFSDVEGWDLQHCRQVRWKEPGSKTTLKGLRRGTLIGVNDQSVRDAALEILKSGKAVTSQTPPPEPKQIDIDEVIDALVMQGLAVGRAELIVNTIWRLRRLAHWYSSHGNNVGEHEIRTFLIIPLLTSLGWPEQKIRIEWCDIDVAIFDTPYSETSKPIAIIESKKLWDGLWSAPTQAENYAKTYPSCNIFVVSDGVRYKLFQKQDDTWCHTSYVNLLSTKESYPSIQGVSGAVKFFTTLLPG